MLIDSGPIGCLVYLHLLVQNQCTDYGAFPPHTPMNMMYVPAINRMVLIRTVLFTMNSIHFTQSRTRIQFLFPPALQTRDLISPIHRHRRCLHLIRPNLTKTSYPATWEFTWHPWLRLMSRTDLTYIYIKWYQLIFIKERADIIFIC